MKYIVIVKTTITTLGHCFVSCDSPDEARKAYETQRFPIDVVGQDNVTEVLSVEVYTDKT